MLGEIQLNELNLFVERLSREELLWLNGYVSGLIKSSSQSEEKASIIANKLTIAFATETGNSKKLATTFATKARNLGVTVRLSSLDQYRMSDLVKEEKLILIISTHGDGEPPAAARKFFSHIHDNKLDLSKLEYGILALGDTAYPLFCKAGEDVDVQLSTLGAKRIITIEKCDVDYDKSANHWFDRVVNTIAGGRKEAPITPATAKYSGRKNYVGRVLSKTNLNAHGSAKETYHMEIEASQVNYSPGDSIGIVPKNSKTEVDQLIQLLGLNQKSELLFRGEEFGLAELLTNRVSISYLPERVVSKYASIVNQSIPSVRIDLVDLLKIYPPQGEDQAINILQVLEPITPRLYSISSSLLAHEDEVHITVARNSFQVNEVTRNGLCSNYLSQLDENAELGFYVHQNSQFKLPSSEKDIILIGPGTGIAPFRSFIEERVNSGATGRSWLFFGDQHFSSDFLYQTEWQNYLLTGGLTRMNVAFSRDQEQKIYVQHKMLEQSKDLWEWIEQGAFVYVCGAKAMSEDAEITLVKIISMEGNKSEEEATLLLGMLAEEGRYLKDVY